jgi:hypothetical protein
VRKGPAKEQLLDHTPTNLSIHWIEKGEGDFRDYTHIHSHTHYYISGTAWVDPFMVCGGTLSGVGNFNFTTACKHSRPHTIPLQNYQATAHKARAEQSVIDYIHVSYTSTAVYWLPPNKGHLSIRTLASTLADIEHYRASARGR